MLEYFDYMAVVVWHSTVGLNSYMNYISILKQN